MNLVGNGAAIGVDTEELFQVQKVFVKINKNDSLSITHEKAVCKSCGD